MKTRINCYVQKRIHLNSSCHDLHNNCDKNHLEIVSESMFNKPSESLHYYDVF